MPSATLFLTCRFHKSAPTSRRILVSQGTFRKSGVSVITADRGNISCGIKRQARSSIICERFGLSAIPVNESTSARLTMNVIHCKARNGAHGAPYTPHFSGSVKCRVGRAHQTIHIRSRVLGLSARQSTSSGIPRPDARECFRPANWPRLRSNWLLNRLFRAPPSFAACG